MSLLLFRCRVRSLKKIRDRYAGQNRGEKTCNTRREEKTEAKRSCAPRCHAIGTRNELPDPTLDAATTRFLLDFARTRAADVIHKRRANESGDTIFRHQTT